jgi:pimeloyl-ACP methyl ester carboxylesterase
MVHTTQIAGHTLTWEEHSSGAETFIFIHGYSGNRAIWSHEIAQFGDLGRCVTLDLPGHYPATVPPDYRSLSQETLLELEVQAITQIAGGRQVTLIGHSTGGLVALGVAALRPDLVARVVALAPVVWGPLTGALGLYQRALMFGAYPIYWAHYTLTQYSLAAIQSGIAGAYSGDALAYRQNRVAAQAVQSWHPIYRQNNVRNLAILLHLLRHCDIRPLVPQIRQPVLLIKMVRVIQLLIRRNRAGWRSSWWMCSFLRCRRQGI